MRSLRGAFNMLVVALWTVVYATRALASRLTDATGDRVIDLARRWSEAIARTTRIEVTAELRASIDPAQPYVFMSNHASAADIWALYVALPVRVRMIAKKQLGRVPFLGWAMRAGRFIFIDRGNATAARRSIDEAARRIAGGDSVLLFPEGTRSRDGRLGPFKKGGFHLAMNAGVAIVPCAVRGAHALLPRGSVLPRAGRIQVVVGTPIPTAGLGEADRDPLIERVRREIAALLGADGVSTSPAPTSAPVPAR
jgi:1-acyl-sn-glycerol-3-phosphate acyltransferase